ncbi:HIT family protein [Planococcus soli]|uniref:HIT family protein n=1 Tax=Planococcus soli TaxID=2666072 RepID=UPI00115CE949|nr:HIT domain-containing protein [Planococcus soli]
MSYETDCPFCNPNKDHNQKIVFENKTCFFLQHDKEQEVLEGSGVIVPKLHRVNVFDLTKEEWSDTYGLLHQAKEYLDAEFAPDGYTLGWNVGEASNQSIGHCHLHVIPRYNDEPLAGRGLRHWLKQPENKRSKDAIKSVTTSF